MKTKARPVWQKLLILFLSPIVVLLMLELLTRGLVLIGLYSLADLDSPPNRPARARFNGVGSIFVPDTDLLWRGRANSSGNCLFNSNDGKKSVPVRTDSHGYRGEGFVEPKPANTYRVMTLGDSCTFGFGVSEEESYPSRLLGWFKELHPDKNVDLVNASAIGYTSTQVLHLMELEGWNYEPDLLIIAVGFNDAVKNNTLPDSSFIHAKDFSWWLTGVLRESTLYRTLRSFILSLRPAKKEYSARVPTDEYERNLHQLVSKAKNRRITVILTTISAPPDYQTIARDVAESEGIPYVDCENLLEIKYTEMVQTGQTGVLILDAGLRDYYSGSTFSDRMMDYRQLNLVFFDPCHPNAEGHRVIASAIFDTLQNYKSIN